MTTSNIESTARNEIDQLNRQHYSGTAPDRAFAHWALRCLLGDKDIEDSELVELTAVGGPRDLGIDGYCVDQENTRLILLQAKGTRVNRTDVQEFRAAITALVNERFVLENANAVLKEAFPSIQDCLFDESFSIYAVLAAGDRIMPAARSYCEGPGSEQWIIPEDNFTHTKDFQLEVQDIPTLSETKRRLSFGDTPRVTLPILRNDNGHPTFHDMGGDFKSILATIPASALAEAYEEFRSAIFSFNPRGPQGSNKVNNDILETLKDPLLKSHFHLLNNGITVVCDSLTVDEATDSVRIENFQIVNGCQTVYTLFRAKPKLDESVRCNVRLIEGLARIHERIAKASNSQTGVKAEQLASLDPVHDRIHDELDKCDPPWYYEKQLGHLRLLTEAQRRAHRTRYQDRKISITHLGQYGAAFLGFPILAKHDLKAMFERRSPGDRIYNTMFNSNNTAEQMLLPFIVGRLVTAELKTRLGRLRANNPGATSEQFPELDWAGPSFYHLVALVGSVLRRKNGSPGGNEVLLPARESKELIDSRDKWFFSSFDSAYSAVEWVYDVQKAARGTGTVQIRSFFRDQKLYEDMVSRALR